MIGDSRPQEQPQTFLDRLFRGLRRTLNVVALAGLAMVALDPSHVEFPWYLAAKELSVGPIYAVYLAHLILALILSRPLAAFLRDHALDLIFFLPLFTLTFGGVHPAHILMVRQLLHYFQRYLQYSTLGNLAQSISERPARLISLSFAGVILLGGFLLVLPISVTPGNQPSFLAALFTSTSAVCVTGLIVVDTPTYFSLFGQIVILALIQIGGLGIMALSAGVALLTGKRLGISERSVMQNVLDAADFTDLRQTVSDIFTWTLVIEGVGALILGLRFWWVLGSGFLEAAWFGVFHSVSAFCNAGFALFSDSLISYVEDPIISLTICGLIICGGMGFAVLGTLNGFLIGRGRKRIDTHSVLAVVMTLALLVGGMAVILVLEFPGEAMKGLGFGDKLMAAFFQSVTCRTAGFNTIDFGILGTPALFFCCILMFIGACPGSTGGGIKTTTAATMALALDAQIRGVPDVVIRERTIPQDTVLKAFLITGISASLVAVYTFLLLLFDDQPLIKILFEVVSAFATVGLSTGITATLSSVSKMLIITLMFIGRIGPLTLALSFKQSPDAGNVHYPMARVLVG